MKTEQYWCDMCGKEIPDRKSGHTIAILVVDGQREQMAHNLVFNKRYTSDWTNYKEYKDFCICDSCKSRIKWS